MIVSEISGQETVVRDQLERLLGTAKTERSKRHEPTWERCKWDYEGVFPPKMAAAFKGDGRSHRFYPLAETYGNIWVAQQMEAHAPRLSFFQVESEDEAGEQFENAMQLEMLHVTRVGGFRRGLRKALVAFRVYGFAPVLTVYDSELEVERIEVLNPESCWLDPDPLDGTPPERIWRCIERKTTVPDLLREQEASGGKRYDAEALKRLAERKARKGQGDEPEAFSIFTWWGDFYLSSATDKPSTIMQQHEAIWVSQEELLHFAPTDTPGNKTPLHIWSHSTNVYGDAYGRPVLAPGVPVQSLANAVWNQGVDYASTQIKITPWIRQGSFLANRGIVFGQPIISERRDDFDIGAGASRTGTGMDLLFSLMPQLRQDYARAIGAQDTHGNELAARTATENRIQAGAVDTSARDQAADTGAQIELTLEQLQQMRARRLAEKLQAGQNPDGLVGRRRKDSDAVNEDGQTFGDVPATAWAQRFKIKMLGAGLIADRESRMAGYATFIELSTKAIALDPALEGRLSLAETLQNAYTDMLGVSRGSVLRTNKEQAELAAKLAGVVPPPQPGEVPGGKPEVAGAPALAGV